MHYFYYLFIFLFILVFMLISVFAILLCPFSFYYFINFILELVCFWAVNNYLGNKISEINSQLNFSLLLVY